MIVGTVTAEGEAVIELAVRGPEGETRQIRAVIDTGFDGWLTLPASLVTAMRLQWRSRGRAMLADGSDSVFDTYEASVVWDGVPRRVSVDEVDVAPLVGMSLLRGYELTIAVVEGGSVIVNPLPSSAS